MRFYLQRFLILWGMIFAAITTLLLVVAPFTRPDVVAQAAHGEVLLHDRAVNVQASVTEGEPLAVSSDGNYLFYRVRGEPGFYRVEVFTRARTTIATTADGPTVAPTGNHIAYVSDGRGYDDIHLIDVETGGENPLHPFDWNEHFPYWSADGRYLAFVIGKGGTRDLYVYDIETHTHRQITTLAAGRADLPTWHPDEPRLAYLVMGIEDRAMYLLDVETVQSQRISDIGERVTSIFDVRWRTGSELALEFRDVDFGRTEGTIVVAQLDRPE
ncbi:MAG: hypothetical protein AAF653_14500 [Chloroflexota bacterium]